MVFNQVRQNEIYLTQTQFIDQIDPLHIERKD